MSDASTASAAHATRQRWVIDTNCVLDLWLFDDPALRAWRAQLQGAALCWLASAAMRAELACVLGYARLQPWLQRHPDGPQAAAAQVLAAFDRWAQLVPQPVHRPGPPRCRDRADQPYIDLALAHQAHLLSKDRDLLRMARALARRGVWVGAQPQAAPMPCAPIQTNFAQSPP